MTTKMPIKLYLFLLISSHFPLTVNQPRGMMGPGCFVELSHVSRNNIPEMFLTHLRLESWMASKDGLANGKGRTLLKRALDTLSPSQVFFFSLLIRLPLFFLNFDCCSVLFFIKGKSWIWLLGIYLQLKFPLKRLIFKPRNETVDGAEKRMRWKEGALIWGEEREVSKPTGLRLWSGFNVAH